jgi:cation diffusion facilitator CzcD-associated flavoprotein CzcO
MSRGLIEHTDVLIVGAGLSGVGAACQLRQECPDKSVVVLEARAAIGGTWDLFRYPGIRSDSDMFTLGYRFRPWTDPKAIADGASILRYINDTAREFDVQRLIRLNHRVVEANWDSDESCWTVEMHRSDTDQRVTLTCSFLYVCSGYYRYDLASGYVQRSVAELPKQGERAPWRLHQNYVRDVRLLRRGPIDDDVVFTPAVPARSATVKSIA